MTSKMYGLHVSTIVSDWQWVTLARDPGDPRDNVHDNFSESQGSLKGLVRWLLIICSVQQIWCSVNAPVSPCMYIMLFSSLWQLPNIAQPIHTAVSPQQLGQCRMNWQ